MFNGANATLTHDRFNNSNSALDLNNGFYQLPNGVYFNGPFTIAAWFKAREPRPFSRLVDIGLNDGSSNIVLVLFSGSNQRNPYIRVNSTLELALQSNTTFNLNNWTHIAATYDGANLKLFMNGEIVGQGFGGVFSNVNRTNNFIGRSWNTKDNPNANAIFDEIRFYNRELSQDEIKAIKSL